jgi:hypothetical protein
MTATPGPWKVDDQFGGTEDDPRLFIRGENSFVAQTVGGNDDANAHLIAAAPELLKVCKIIQAEFDRLPNIAEVFAEEKCFLDSVIAQAEGESK